MVKLIRASRLFLSRGIASSVQPTVSRHHFDIIHTFVFRTISIRVNLHVGKQMAKTSMYEI